ncbi:iron-sulfur cluster biosynthesis family protein [Enterococcus italicus]|uniref:iron-sulfur cluster biosynthesis family protein n=1 Tax=Enterococcus italicus TaxID=246144 RepID=UPI002072BA54|nr:iron-sulfur cluster biosynthesis family protein [Enterococcus italicus]MCM6881560.1 iron-sulfur cluster biosynthesis family protein [Enterococcus italicus]
MELSISSEAQAVIQAKLKTGDRLLLDNEDGHGPFVDHAVSCQLNSGFRLLLVSEAIDAELLADYSIQLPTEIGPVFVKPSGTFLLDAVNYLMIEPSYKRLQLKSDGGILSPNIPIIRKEREDIG